MAGLLRAGRDEKRREFNTRLWTAECGCCNAICVDVLLAGDAPVPGAALWRGFQPGAPKPSQYQS